MGSLFLVVRHGETEWSANGRHTSVTDLTLTPKGEADAAALSSVVAALIAEALPGNSNPSIAVHVSPRTRAQRTAELALGGSVRERWTVTDDLAEWSYGEFEGLRTVEIEARSPGWDLFADGCPQGESLDDVAARCDRFIERTDGAADVIMAFCHGHLSRVLVPRLLGMSAYSGRTLWNDTASVAVVRERKGQRVLTAWNVRPPALR